MSAGPYGAAPPPRRSGGLALFLAGAVVGGIAGGAVAVGVGASGSRGEIAPAPSAAPATLAPAPIIAPRPAGSSTGDPVADVAAELSGSVVTVVNKLSSGQPQSSGSGSIVDSRRGFVITNNHVVANVRGTGVGASFDVIFPDNRKVAAKLVGRDEETDVAVLEVGQQNVKPLVLGNSDDAPIGGSVVAIGSALGEFRNSVTAGVLSGKGRRLPSETRPDIFLEDLIQTDAAISPGNSGGPLILVSTKQVIGMNTLVVREQGSEGLGFAISSNTVRQIADELIKNGQVVRGRIGVAYQLLSTRGAQLLGLPTGASGAQITDVVPGSPAASAGIKPGDVITKVNDQQIDEDHPLATIMLRYRPSDKVRLTIVRGGQQQVLEITLGRPA